MNAGRSTCSNSRRIGRDVVERELFEKLQCSVVVPASIEYCNHLDRGTGASPTIIRFLPTRMGPRSRRCLKYESANGGAAQQNGNDPCQVFTVHFVPLLVPFHQAQGDIRSSNRERYSAPP